MTSYFKKYVTAFASAKDYVAQWSSDHVYADEALIVPFPTLAIFDPTKHVWSVNIKAWLYLPFEGKKLKSYLPSLPSFITKKPNETTTEDTTKIDADDKLCASIPTEENNKIDEQNEEPSDDDMYEDALGN